MNIDLICHECKSAFIGGEKPLSILCRQAFCPHCPNSALCVNTCPLQQILPITLKLYLNSQVNPALVEKQCIKQLIDDYIRVCFLGQLGVGKTSLIYMLSHKEFHQNFPTTFGFHIESKDAQLSVSNDEDMHIKYQFQDNTSYQTFRTLTVQHFKNADIFVLVYDHNDSAENNKLGSWIDEICHNANTKNVIVVGNKYDFPNKQQDYGSQGNQKTTSRKSPITQTQIEAIKILRWNHIQ